jgi:release factor glutamine methyltransferase
MILGNEAVTTGGEGWTWFRRLRAAGARYWLTLRYQLLDRRHGRLTLEKVEGVPLLILPQVFNPVLFRSGVHMARALMRYPPERGHHVLDLGCGSGIGAIFAARSGARVTAVDINPEAVRCTQINALLNGQEEKIEILEGDLFEAVVGHLFDLVLFNPPFYRGRPRDLADNAWRGIGVFERFTQGLDSALAPGGRAFLVLSSDGAGDELLKLLAQVGFQISVASRQDLVNEIISVFEVRRASNP